VIRFLRKSHPSCAKVGRNVPLYADVKFCCRTHKLKSSTPVRRINSEADYLGGIQLNLNGKFMLSRFLWTSLATLCFIAYASGQEAPVPPAHAECHFPDGKQLTLDYFSPGMNGRKIFGGSVPYGRVWQPGANHPTTFVTNTNLMVGGKNVPAGKYTIFTIPDPHTWKLIINKRIARLDFPYVYESSELVRIDLLVRPLPAAVENFTIAVDQRRGGCVLNLRWENTEASVLVAEVP
jgi:hypothetical protein